ncbi:MAG: hypothetical protein WAO98_10220 [Alphaproteobacteria bacterium]
MMPLRKWIFTPPFYGVPWIVWLYAVLCCFLFRDGGIFAGILSGYDDHVRMVQVLNWINGADWYDRTLTRVNAPEGFTTIWSRLVDIPIAVVVLLFQQIASQKTAALIAAIVVPLMQLGILFAASIYFARPLVGKKYARLVVLFLMFTTVMNYYSFSISGFHPGEASHHPWYIILTLVVFGAAGRMALQPVKTLPSLTFALSGSLLLAVGIEALAILAGAASILAFMSWYNNQADLAKRSAIAFALTGLFSFILLPLHQPLVKLFHISFAEPSLLGPFLCALAAFFFVMAFWILTECRNKKLSFGMITIVGGFIASALIFFFPEILQGPATALTPDERVMAFREHAEAQPLLQALESWSDYLFLTVPSLIALATAIYAIRSAPTKRRKSIYIIYFSFAAFTFGMSQWISRFYHHALTTACPWLLGAWEDMKQRLLHGPAYTLSALFIFIGLIPLWTLLLPALKYNLPIQQVLFYPAKLQMMGDACNTVAFGEYLNRHYGKNTLLMVPGADSSRLLYHSNLRIDFLNNYPSQNKFIDNLVFFATQDQKTSQQIAQAHGFDLVAVCRISMNRIPLKPGEEPMTYERLENGEPPIWLKPINTGIPGYKLYRVDKALLMK